MRLRTNCACMSGRWLMCCNQIAFFPLTAAAAPSSFVRQSCGNSFASTFSRWSSSSTQVGSRQPAGSRHLFLASLFHSFFFSGVPNGPQCAGGFESVRRRKPVERRGSGEPFLSASRMTLRMCEFLGTMFFAGRKVSMDHIDQQRDKVPPFTLRPDGVLLHDAKVPL